jgi:hypothetical protein
MIQISSSPMTETEAREATSAIKDGLVNLRQLLLEVYERGGWKALGYATFIEYAQIEFDYGKSRAYQLIDAATVERNLRYSTMVENALPIPERHLRPITLRILQCPHLPPILSLTLEYPLTHQTPLDLHTKIAPSAPIK